MEAPHWTRVATYLIVIPAVAYWLIVQAFHIHDTEARQMIATVVSIAAVILAVSRLG